jgi:hypothetical protein
MSNAQNSNDPRDGAGDEAIPGGEVGIAAEALDRATAARLARLRTLPVEMSKLQAAVSSQIPRPSMEREQIGQGDEIRWHWTRRMRAAAASVAILIGLTIAFVAWQGVGGGRAALASPPHMAALHARLVAGEIPVTEVASIEAADEVLASQSAQSPRVPDLPQQHVMACCLNQVDDRVVACLLLKQGDKPVSMMVADAKAMRSPPGGGETIDRDGVRYRVHTCGTITMVMSARHDRWVCVMGELPAADLVDLASTLKY